MRVIKSEHINPFITGTIETVESVTGIKLGIVGTSVTNSPIQSCGTMVQVGVVGDIKGSMLANINENTKYKILGIMFGGMDIKGQSSEMLNSAIGELFNMVMGTVATKLEGIGVKIDITPPNVISGEEASVSVSKSPAIELNLKNEDLDLKLYLSIK